MIKKKKFSFWTKHRFTFYSLGIILLILAVLVLWQVLDTSYGSGLILLRLIGQHIVFLYTWGSTLWSGWGIMVSMIIMFILMGGVLFIKKFVLSPDALQEEDNIMGFQKENVWTKILQIFFSFFYFLTPLFFILIFAVNFIVGSMTPSEDALNSYLDEHKVDTTLETQADATLSKVITSIDEGIWNEEFIINTRPIIEDAILTLDGPVNASQHYLRNYLNDAPETLDLLFEQIETSSQKWVLFTPITSAYHQFGTNGEYNLKFVCVENCDENQAEDLQPYFEAIYDKDGNVVLDDVNMGTLNWADYLKDPDLHDELDVIPYYLWGNTKEENKPVEILDLLENIQNFFRNSEARRNYDEIKEKFDQLSQ